jgi:hypothetical protein
MSYKNLIFFNKSGHQSNLIWNGDFWEARLMLPRVSVDLFEIEHFFIVEKFLDLNANTVYGYPHLTPDITATTTASGIYGDFKAGSNVVKTDAVPLVDYIGAKVFTSQFPQGNEIVAVDTSLNRITLKDPSALTENGIPLIFNLWKSSFETTRNVLDFDAFDSFNGDIIEGTDYVTTSSDLSKIKISGDYLTILGNGIPKNARITSIVGNKIYLNKTCNVNITNTTIFVYPVEEKNDVSDYIFQYEVLEDETLDAPVLNKLQDSYIKIGYDGTESVQNDIRTSNYVDSSSVTINIALNSTEEGIFGRTLVIEDYSLGYPKIIARIEIHGETIGEDERYKTLLSNFGRKLNSEDAYILRPSDPKEPYTDYEIINAKRKELLLEGHEIFSYLGSYKGLINAIRFFGYQDLRVKEYWLNVKKSDTSTTALKENSDFMDKLKSKTQSQSTLIGNLLDDENAGKYKQVEIYGKKTDGTYGLKSSMEELFPSSSYKKTALFGLFYDINVVVDDAYDEFGYPITENADVFSPDEVLIKLFGLKEKLKKDYLPLNARIIDITGEGVYFGIYKNRLWIDNLKIDELQQGIDLDLAFTPDYGYVEDLRPFYLRPNKYIPFVPFVGENPSFYKYTTYGNDVEPKATNPIFTGTESKKLADSIKLFYERRNSGEIKHRLGDGDSKNNGYFKLFDGQRYEVPAGFPTVLEVTTFNISWDEVGNHWNALENNFATYSTSLASWDDTGYTGDGLIDSSLSFTFDTATEFGTLFSVTLPDGLGFLRPSTGSVQLKFTSTDDDSFQFLCEVQNGTIPGTYYDETTGETPLKILSSKGDGIMDTWKVELVNTFSDLLDFEYYDYSFNPGGFYSWDNLRFAGFYEIEWTVIKRGEVPFYYEFRGAISDYYKLPIILPYDGIYSVKCRVWDGFNDICTVNYENCIEVKKREIELTNIARFRETEVYTWENTRQNWDDYISMWLFPVENGKDPGIISNQILNPAEYGNQFNEGQECKVLKSYEETIGSGTCEFGLQTIQIDTISSDYSGGGKGPAIITIDPAYLPHGFSAGDDVLLIDNYNQHIQSSSTNTFTLGAGGTLTVNTGLDFIAGKKVRISHNYGKYQISEIVSYDPVTGILVFGAPTKVSGRGTKTFTAVAGFNFFLFPYRVGYVEVLINNVLTSPSNYSATDGVAVFLNSGYSVGDSVKIREIIGPYNQWEVSSQNYSGNYTISSVTNDGFYIPLIMDGAVDGSDFTLTEIGSITINYEGKRFTKVDFNGRLDTTLGNLMSKFNNSKKDPAFAIDTIFNDSDIVNALVQEWKDVTFKAPIGSGNSFNGKYLDIITTGGLFLYDGQNPVKSLSVEISGGVNPYSEYVDYNFNGDLPVENIRYYGTKKLDWDAFDILEWDNLYAQTWQFYDYHNDWLGGFSLYNLQAGDKIRVGASTKGIVLGNDTNDNSPGYLDLREACNQLNASKDKGISKFYYEVRGFSKLPGKFDIDGSTETSPLTCLAIPYNEETESYDLQENPYVVEGPTSIVQDRNGDIIMGGESSIKLFRSPDDIDVFDIATRFPGSTPRKVLTDEYSNWWCYGDYSDIPLLIFDRENPENTRIFTSQPIADFARPDLNFIVPVPDDQFQVISLAVDALSENFVMYIKYFQSYSVSLPDSVFRLVEYNAGSQEFNTISTVGPVWNVNKIYDQGSVVSYLGNSYLSLLNTNHQRNPTAYSDYWEKIYQPNPGVVDLTLYYIRQMKYHYIGKESELWIATNDGIKIYDGVKIKTINTDNSGLHSKDIYSITFDEVGGKWIGTSNGIAYYDNGRWGCWTPASNPELPIGRSRNIINLGNGRIFFMLQYGSGLYKLIYFNGINFIVYDNNPGTSEGFSPGSGADNDYEDLYLVLNKTKFIDGKFTRYVNDLFYLGDSLRGGDPYVDPSYWDITYVGYFSNGNNVFLKKINYLVPYVHASSKSPGMLGWDFIYHLSFRPYADPIYIKNKGLGDVEINFNLIIGPLYTSSINIGKDPQLPYVDRTSWKLPEWIKYDFNDIIDSHPGIDKDDLFLDAPLRDIISGKAKTETYWKNSNVIRSAARDTGNLIDSFEWVIKIGDSSDDRGTKIFIDSEGYVYATGYFNGNAYFGAKNNLPTGANTTLPSPNNQSIFVVKYNEYGVVQWARKYGGTDSVTSSSDSINDYSYTPTGIKVDHLGNVIVIGYKSKTRNNTTNEKPTNIFLKWDFNAHPLISSTLFDPSSNTADDTIKDLAIDRVGNTYITGVYKGTLTSGLNSITSSGNNYEVFIARVEDDGYIKWLYKAGTGGNETNPSIQIGNAFEDLYLAFNTTDGSSQKIVLNRYSSYDFELQWSKDIVNTNYGVTPTSPRIKVSGNGEIALGATFSGSLSSNGNTIDSNGDSDIAIFKFNGFRTLWAKNVGSSSADYCQDVDIDSEGSIFILGSYGGKLIASPEISSPNYYPSPEGNLDLIMFKYSNIGTLLDVVDAGGIAKDEGISLSIDNDDNIYLTGYISGESQFSNWITSPSGGEDAFVGKISNLRYQTGNKNGNVFSWFGSGSWQAGESKIFKEEFEIPIGTTVVFNPIDSLIPGKKNHVWKLIYDGSGEEIINIKDAQSFIWTFNQPGFYTIYSSVEDSNGNVSVHDKNGYIRVIDHKNPPPGELVLSVTSDTFRRRSIYELGSKPQLI